MPEPSAGTPSPLPQLRRRLAAEIAAGKTLSLSREEMADPELRRRLPGLLAELTGAAAEGVTAGVHLPGYTVLGVIGQGGMSTVYLARQDTLGRHVALKVAAWSGTDRKMRQRMLQEARAMARVAHPNIVAIHDIVEAGDTVAIAMEWIDGLTLAGLLRALPPAAEAGDMDTIRNQLGTSPEARSRFDASPVRFFVRLLRDVARALQRVHETGLLHLDVKPSNVLVRRDGTPLLADFGVVREIDLGRTNTRSFAGTPIYSAPEQLHRDRGLGPATDVYGLGITLYEMLARRQPLKDHGLTRLVEAIERGRVPALGTQVSIAKDLETIVQKAMAAEPRHRYASAGAFADDLDAFLDGRPVTARPLSPLRRAQRWARLEPWKAALLAVLLVTVPVVAFLGVELLLGMRHIEAGQLRERRQQANERIQTAYQLRFFGWIGADEAAALLREAMALDPSDTSLACMASMLAADEPEAAQRLLGQHPQALAAHAGLRCLARKAHEQRPFFLPTEIEELSASSSALDTYVLALDRALFANDRSSLFGYEEALRHVDAAAIGQEPDPLLLGLRAWFARCAQRRDIRDSTCRTLMARWPGSSAALRWYFCALWGDEPEAAAAAAWRWIERDPSGAEAWELLIRGSIQAKDYAQALALIDRARAQHVVSPIVGCSRVLALMGLGRREEAYAELAAIPPSEFTFSDRLRMSFMEGPAALRQFCDEHLAAPGTTRTDLEVICQAADTSGDADLVGRAFARWHRSYPNFRQLYTYEISRLFAQRDLPGAAALARECDADDDALDHVGTVYCILFTSARYWPELATLAERWLQHGAAQNRAQAAFYAGLAASRQGDMASAAPYLAAATVTTATDNPSGWFTSALLERAWVLVAPATPATLRDPATARLLVDRFEAANRALPRPRSGPWIQAVTAEVLFASGNVQEAVRTAKAGLDAVDDQRLAPPANCRELLRDALTRYGE